VRTHSFVVKVDVPADKGLITGMYGKAFFPTGKREAIMVPKSAIVDMSGISGVYVVSADGNAVFQMIQSGEATGNDLEVVSGLKKGDRVIADNHIGRIEGRKVLLANNN
jgi:multidrug efflux pump subunit AcrA (membrane-fusion protein)